MFDNLLMVGAQPLPQLLQMLVDVLERVKARPRATMRMIEMAA
jgi:hypothetical protein